VSPNSNETLVAKRRFLPHPFPLPLGEGTTFTALSKPGRLVSTCRCLRFSLSQRERAGEREKGPFSLVARKRPRRTLGDAC